MFAIFIFEVDFSETYLTTSAKNSVSEPLNLKFFWAGYPPPPPEEPYIPRPSYKALAFGTRDNAPPPLPVTKNLATALYQGPMTLSV